MIALSCTAESAEPEVPEPPGQSREVPAGAAVAQAPIKATKYKRKSKAYFNKRQHFEVRMAGDKVVYVRLVRNQDGVISAEWFPYGEKHAQSASELKYYSVKAFKKFMAKRIKKLKKARKSEMSSTRNSLLLAKTTGIIQATPPAYNTGLGLGYNPSTGYVGNGSECYNYTTSLNGGILDDSFSLETGVSSLSETTDVSGSISASFDSFSASDIFSYSHNYDSSANSGQIFLTASATFTANNIFSGVSADGTQQQLGGTFSANCGSQFISSVPVGMFVRGRLSWASSSSTTSQNISNTLTASATGLGGLSSAVSTASSTSNTHYSFAFLLQVIGGGEYSSNIMTAKSDNENYFQSCANGTTADCTLFATAMDQAIANNLADFYNSYTPPTSLPSNIADLAVFPHGITGVDTSLLQAIPVNSLLDSTEYADLFSSGFYVPALWNYLTVLNQISTLQNRTSSLMTALSVDSLNPTPQLDIAGGYLTPLHSTYQGDVGTMMINLRQCMSSQINAIATNCAPIVQLYNDSITDAYLYYSSTGQNPNSFAQQNTIALQYTGLTSLNGNGFFQISKDTYNNSFPLDVVWANALPNPFPYAINGGGYWQPNGYPAIIAFADAPWPYMGNTLQTMGYARLVVLNPNPSSAITTPLNSPLWATPTATATNNMSGTANGWYFDSLHPKTIGIVNDCTDITFSQPCEIQTTSVSQNDTWANVGQNWTIITQLHPIANLFPLTLPQSN